MPPNNNDEIPLIYIFLYKKMKERTFGSSYLNTADVLDVILEHFYHTPGSNFRYAILKEMQERFGLIKKINRMRYEVINNKCEKKLDKIKEEELKTIIKEINKERKVKCYDESIYKIIPNKCLKKLENINTWILG